MAVNIDPSEVRNTTSPAQPIATPRRRLPMRAVAIGGLGGVGLLAFSVGAFSFFSTLADPRARAPRTMPAAASMPDLKDGMPVLVTNEPTASARAATLNLPRPDAVAPVAQPVPSQPAAAAVPAPEPAPITRAASSEPPVPALHTGSTPPPIQNVATLPEPRIVTPAAPPTRTATTIAPARSETVKAKPAQVPAVASVSPSETREPVPEPVSTATAVAPPASQPARKPVAAKPPVQKTAARKPASTRTVAEAEPASAPVAAAADDSEIPGARQFRAGVKAIGGFFGGDAKDD